LKPTEELFRSAKPIWDAELRHPFVVGLGDGSLDVEKFERWVLQDYLYLKEFARVFAWAVAKANELAAMGWYAKVLDLTLNTEMSLHRSYAERFGLTAAQLEQQEMWPTTRAYTDFLVRVSAEGDMLDLLAALLPCAWGYVYVAQHLAKVKLPADERYADWITQYASDEFSEAADWLREELDRLAVGITPEKMKRLTELFVLSSRYEWQFWEMCWGGEQWGPG
jgi:thiaminase/transcriptional activator TenA